MHSVFFSLTFQILSCVFHFANSLNSKGNYAQSISSGGINFLGHKIKQMTNKNELDIGAENEVQPAYTNLRGFSSLQLNCQCYLFNILSHFHCISLWVYFVYTNLGDRKLTITGEELQSLPSITCIRFFNVLLPGRSPVHYLFEDAHLIPPISLIP